MDVYDTHVGIGECNACLIQLGKLRGHRGGVIKAGLCKLDPQIEYGGTARGTAISGTKSVPLVFERWKEGVVGDEGIYVLLDVEP